MWYTFTRNSKNASLSWAVPKIALKLEERPRDHSFSWSLTSEKDLTPGLFEPATGGSGAASIAKLRPNRVAATNKTANLSSSLRSKLVPIVASHSNSRRYVQRKYFSPSVE